MSIRTRGKQDVITGTPGEIVESMGAVNFVTHSNKVDYMEQAARRVRILTNTVISTTDARTFLYGLQRAGMIKVLYDRPVDFNADEA
jgi:D-arabinose 1-dehydrogenase-like Zn-dependent alcohol dehydrogenase